MRGGEGAELGSSPWEPSTTAEELVWRRKTKAERERDMGRGEATGGHGPRVQRATESLENGPSPEVLAQASCPRTSGDPGNRKRSQSHAYKVTQSEHQGALR